MGFTWLVALATSGSLKAEEILMFGKEVYATKEAAVKDGGEWLRTNAERLKSDYCNGHCFLLLVLGIR